MESALETVRAPGATAGEIEAAYRLRHHELLRVATAITGSVAAGEDAVQEALARVLTHRAAFRRSGSVEAWLWKAVVNAARNVRRRRTPEQLHEGGVADAPDDEGASIRAGLAALPERQRLVLFLRYYADLDYQTIADVVGVRRGTVSATLHQAHAAVRRLLENDEVPR